MTVKVREAKVQDILQFINNLSTTKEDLPDYLEPVLCKKNITALLTARDFKKNRKGYLAYLGEVKVGYCVTAHFKEEKILDLLYVSDNFRQQGIAKKLINTSEANTVVVNAKNIPALNLYKSLGLKIEFDE